MARKWLRQLCVNWFQGGSKVPRTRSAAGSKVSLCVEGLESRTMPVIGSFTISMPASVVCYDQAFNMTVQGYTRGGALATGSGTADLICVNPNGVTEPTQSFNFANGVFSETARLSTAGIYSFYVTYDSSVGPVESGPFTITGTAPVLNNVSIQPTLERPLPLGSAFVGMPLQVGISATDTMGNPWCTTLTVKSSNAAVLPLGYVNGLPVNSTTVNLSNGSGVVTVTPLESSVAASAPAPLTPTTLTVKQPGSGVSASTSITTITTGFTFDVGEQVQVVIPTEGSGIVTVATLINGRPSNPQPVMFAPNTPMTLSDLTLEGPGANDLFNWVENTIIDGLGVPGGPSSLTSEAYDWITATAGYPRATIVAMGSGVQN